MSERERYAEEWELARLNDAMVVARMAVLDCPEDSRLQEEYQHRALTYHRAAAARKGVNEF